MIILYKDTCIHNNIMKTVIIMSTITNNIIIILISLIRKTALRIGKTDTFMYGN